MEKERKFDMHVCRCGRLHADVAERLLLSAQIAHMMSMKIKSAS